MHATFVSGRRILAVLAISVLLVTGQRPITYAAPPPPTADRIEVKDVSAVYDGAASRLGPMTQPADSLMTEDFEGTWPAAGWALSDLSTGDGGDYLSGKRNCHPYKGSYAGWSVGGGVQGSQLACGATYPNNLFTWAVYGPFDLSTATSASLNFRLWGKAEPGTGCTYDFLYAGSSVDNNNFAGARYCGDWTGGSEANGYHAVELDLSNRLGQKAVWIAFMFRSDSTTTDIGMTVDDVALQTSSNPSPTPTTPTATATATPTATVTEAFTATATATPTATVTEAFTATPTATATATPTPTVTSRPGPRLFLPLVLKFLPPPVTPTVTQTATVTQTPTVTPTASRTPTPSVTPTVTPIPPFAVPMDGDWQGQTNQSRSVAFTVTNGGATISLLTIEVGWSGRCGLDRTVFYLYNLPISGGKFATTSGSMRITGTFSSATAVSGTWQGTVTNYLTSCTATLNGTWSAAK